jgi:probable rRNA maturation factor
LKKKVIKKLDLPSETHILIRNFHPSLNSPITKSIILNKIDEVFRGEKCKLKFLELNLVNNSTIRKVNKGYLSHDFNTDIITFTYEPDKKALEGEIFISLDEVKRNAKEFETGYKEEFLRVIVHGCLHMAGYKDKKKHEIKLMKKKEEQYL